MRARRFVWVALVSMMAACGDDETAETGPSAITIDRLRGEAVGAICDFRVRCGWEPDVDTCRRVEFADNELLQLVADEPRGLSRYDAAAARAWVDAVRAQRCAVHSTAADEQLEAARKAVFTGTVAEGGPCWVDGECQGDRVCDRSVCMDTVECCAGECVAAPARIGIGQPCADASIPCVSGAYCNGDACVATADVGEPCTALAGCQDEQACDVDGAGTCYKLAVSGEKCEPSLGLACAEYDQVCTPEGVCARRAAEGAPCDTDEACLRYAACVDGMCTRRPSEGQPCSDVPSCLGDLVCATGACARPTILVCGG